MLVQSQPYIDGPGANSCSIKIRVDTRHNLATELYGNEFSNARLVARHRIIVVYACPVTTYVSSALCLDPRQVCKEMKTQSVKT